MTTTRNKDGELWDPATGFVYNDDGSVKRPGLAGIKPLSKAEAVKEDDHDVVVADASTTEEAEA